MNSLQVTNDILLDYIQEGRRSGVPIVLLHGFTDSRRSFDRVLARLPKSIHAIAVSQRGHGDSERPRVGYAPRHFAADVVALMDKLGIPKAVVLGHSMGGIVAQRFAIDYPERVLGLVLVGSFYTLRMHPAGMELWESSISTLEDPVDPAFVRGFQQSTLAQAVPSSFFDVVVQESLKVPARVWRDTMQALLSTDFSSELPRIQAPTLLLWGNRDAFVNESEQEALLATIPRSTLKVYEGVGHSPHWEDPSQFVIDVEDFITRL